MADFEKTSERFCVVTLNVKEAAELAKYLIGLISKTDFNGTGGNVSIRTGMGPENTVRMAFAVNLKDGPVL